MKKIALLVFTEGRDREDVYRQRKPFLTQELEVLRQSLEGRLELYCPVPEQIRDKAGLRQAAAELAGRRDLCGCLLYVGTFVNAADLAMAVRMLAPLPCALLANHHRQTMAMVGFFAAAGALEQAGLPFARFDGDIREEETVRGLCAYFQAAYVQKKLLGETYGLVGGRALGISTGSADGAQWLKQFGVDMTHIDQMELVARARQASPEKVRLYREWIQEYYGRICFAAGRFEEAHLERMIRSYLAAKELAQAYELDFMGIKCQPELSNGYVLQCLAVQLLNDPYDAEGPKTPLVCSCEADCDGALTMEILKHISGGKPTALQDIYCFEGEDQLVLANCGAGASYFAGCGQMRQNLSRVYLQPHVFGAAGGAATQFNYAPARHTYARLTRSGLRYRMLVTRGQAVEKTREDLQKYAWYRPTCVTRLEVPAARLREKLSSNHLLCVEGDYAAELAVFCRLLGIECELLTDPAR